MEPKGPFCQSCGMPLSAAEDFGTSADGFRINDYCHFCFQQGEFTDRNATEHTMIERCARVMAQKGIMPEPQARALMQEMLPRLKRWRAPAPSSA